MADNDHTARLEPFLLLARSTKGAAAAKIISDATAAPGVYTFGELLEIPGIKALSEDANLSKSYQLLILFAYGNLSDYSNQKDTYPPLNPAHLIKLQHLTLMSLAMEHRSLPYDDLIAALQLPSIRALEDLIIDVMYSGLLAGKMHHHERMLHIDWVAGRDVSPMSLPLVQQRLEDWCTTAQNLLAALDERIAEVRSTAHQESAALAAYKSFRNDQYLEVSKEGRSKKESYNGGPMRTQNQIKDNWQGESEMIERSMGGPRGGMGSGTIPLPSGSGGSSTTRRMLNKQGAQSADDAFGVKAKGSKRQRDL